MDSTDQPGQPAIDQPTEPPAAVTATRPNGFRRTVITAGMAAALLIAGGVAVVSAASPDPSASPMSTATTDPTTDGSTSSGSAPTLGERGDCPAEDGDADTSATPSSAT
jgi:hypothetical protein